MRITSINPQMNTNRMNQNASGNRTNITKGNVNFGTIFQDTHKAFEIAKNPARFFNDSSLKPNIKGHPVLERIVALAGDANNRIVRLSFDTVRFPQKGGTVEPRLRLIPSFENLPSKDRARYLKALEEHQKGKEGVTRNVETDPIVDPLGVWGDVPSERIDIDNEPFGLFRFRGDNPKYNAILQADNLALLPLRVLKATPDIADWLLPKLAPEFLDENEQLIIRNLRKQLEK